MTRPFWIFRSCASVCPVADDNAPSVRQVIGSNIRRIRTLRRMKGQQLVDRLDKLGFPLPISGLSEVETAKRRVTVEELLIFAIALNTSVIDLITPTGGSPLAVADGVEPLEPAWLEPWLRGEIPLPQELWGDGSWGSLMAFDPAQIDEFHAATSEHRRMMHRRDARPEMVAIDGLRERVRRAIEATEDPRASEIIEADVPPESMAEKLRTDLEAVTESVNLLVKHIDRHGYASR